MAEAQELRRKGPQEGQQCKDQFNTWTMEMRGYLSECLEQAGKISVEKPALHLVSKPQEENVLVEVLALEHISKAEDLKGAVVQLSNTKKSCVDDCKVKQEQDLEQKEVESPNSASADKSLERSVSCFDAKPDFNDCKVKANKGSPTAQYKLGVLYRKGKVVKTDYQEALKWFRKSAAQGNSRARKALREMILKKQGVLLKK
jgi:hypothetical protein